MKPWTAKLQQALNERKATGLYRSLQQIPAGQVDFLSNDYLGFAREKLPAQPEAMGSGGSRLLGGNSAAAVALESQLAAWGKAAAALLFTSGYMANVGVLSCIPDRHSTIFYDSLAHACIKDGIRLSQAKAFSFPHNALDALENKLRKAKGPLFVVVESVYSMDGDRAPLVQLHRLCKKYEAVLLVDEAHASGLYGHAGTGLCEEEGVVDENVIRILTFGKGMGSHGAAVLASSPVIDYLINFSRPFIYTTALPDAVIIGLKRHFEELSQSNRRRLALQAIVSYFRARWKEAAPAGLEAPLPEGPIQPVLVGSGERTKALAAYVQAKGLAVRAIVSPTVAAGSERLRICLHAYTTKDEVDALISAIVGFALE